MDLRSSSNGLLTYASFFTTESFCGTLSRWVWSLPFSSLYPLSCYAFACVRCLAFTIELAVSRESALSPLSRKGGLPFFLPQFLNTNSACHCRIPLERGVQGCTSLLLTSYKYDVCTDKTRSRVARTAAGEAHALSEDGTKNVWGCNAVQLMWTSARGRSFKFRRTSPRLALCPSPPRLAAFTIALQMEDALRTASHLSRLSFLQRL